MEELEYVVREEDLGDRLDRILSGGLGVSRSRLQRWMERGLVTAGGGRVLGPRDRCVAGERVRIAVPDAVPDRLEPEDHGLEILYEDGDVLFVNKPAGMTVHPGAGVREGTLAAALLYHCAGRLSGVGGVERPGIVHRLDRDTSGVMVVAKNDFAHEALGRAFQGRTVEKTYLAYLRGEVRPAAGSWKGAIGRHPVVRQKMTVRERGGRASHTDYRILRAGGEASLVELKLHTGRTHQIRVHAAHAGHPVVGDAVYGRGAKVLEGAGVRRQLLHAHVLVLAHPRTGRRLEITAPLPEDFTEFESWLERQTVRVKGR